MHRTPTPNTKVTFIYNVNVILTLSNWRNKTIIWVRQPFWRQLITSIPWRSWCLNDNVFKWKYLLAYDLGKNYLCIPGNKSSMEILGFSLQTSLSCWGKEWWMYRQTICCYRWNRTVSGSLACGSLKKKKTLSITTSLECKKVTYGSFVLV